MQSSDALIPKYSELVYNGFWFSPEGEALQALITETQRDVTGLVRLKLYRATSSSLLVARVRKAFTIQQSPRWNAMHRLIIKATPQVYAVVRCG
jgi:argininosuccinate synthase